jgi:GNAT superfamily N-acetyltransferase
MEELHLRNATVDDVGALASLATEFIRDGDYRNSMSAAQLTEQMAVWLENDFRAVIFELGGSNVGYALYRFEPEHVHLWQLFVQTGLRRRGIGREALQWLWRHAWKDASRLRIDVLVGNTVGAEFWRAVGLKPYCLTMEMERPIDS